MDLSLIAKEVFNKHSGKIYGCVMMDLPAVRRLSDGCQIDIGDSIFYFCPIDFFMSIILLRV